MQYPYLYEAILGLIAIYNFLFEFFPIVMNI
jgi:hypothetical protein